MRRRTSRPVVLALAAALITTALAACSSDGGDSPGSTAKSLNIWLYQKPVGLFSPLAPASGPDQQVMSLIYESLLTPNPDQQLVPELAAAEPEISEDAKTFTFKIRPDAKWSDGSPLTSKDVVFTYQRAADADTGSPLAAILAGLTFDAPNDETFVITSKTPNVGLLAQIGQILVMPEAQLKDVPVKGFANDKYFNSPKLSSGPFEFVENKVDQYVKVTANPEYPTQPGIKDIYLKPVTPDVAVAQLGTGEMDVASIAANDADSVKAMEGMNVTTSITSGFVRASWNQTEKRFQDPRVRQAFLYGLDREAIVQSALAGHGTVRNSAFDPAVSGDDLEPYAYDPDKAKQLLQEAGWDSSQPVELAWVPNANPDRDAAATAIEDQLNQVGIKIKLKQVQPEWFTSAYEDKSFDMVLYGGGNYAVDSWNVKPIVSCDTWYPAGANISFYCDKDLDKVMAQANTIVDETQRLADYQDAAKIENGDPSMMWLYSPQATWAARSDLTNFVGLDPSGGGFYKPEDWTLD